MSEIIDDIKTQTIEITSNLGLNLSANNPRIKHTGSGTVTIETISSNESALVLSAPNGGIEILSDNITIGTSTTENTLPGNVTIHGNLTVDGDTFTNNVVIYTQEDPVFYINSGFTGVNTNDIGFIGERGTLENVGWIWNEANKEWAAIGTTDNGVDPVVDPISNYKPIKSGGLRVVTDTGNVTPTVFNVAVNGAVDINTSDATNGIDIGTTPSGIPVTIGSATSTVVIAGITFSGGGGGLNTDNVDEGTSNLYFLPTRAVAAVEADANLVLNGAIAASFTHNSANDFTLSHNGGNGRLILTGTKAAGDAIQMNATTVGGGIDINAGSGGITLDTTGSLSLDAGTSSNLTTATGDLTLAATTNSVVVTAGQNCTVDTTGGISLDAGTASNLTTATGDLTLSATANSVVITAGEAAVDAIQMNATTVGGGIDINAGSGGITVDTTGSLSLDAGTSSNLTTATGDLTLAATTNSVVVTAGQNCTVDTTGGISLDAGTASNLTTATGDLTLSATANSVVITAGEAAVDAIQMNATTVGGGIDINSGSGGITVDTTGSLSLDAGTSSNLTTATGNLTLAATTNSVVVTAGQNCTVDTTGGISLDSGTASNLTTATGDLTLSATANSVVITAGEAAVDAIQMNATTVGGGIDINAGSGGVTVDTTGSLSLDAGTSSNLTTATGNLTLAATTNSVVVTAGQNCTVDTTGGISLDAGTASNLTTATGDLTLSATANSVVITAGEAAVDAIQMNATTVGGGIDINAGSGGVTVDTTGSLSLDAGTASNLTTATGDLTLAATTNSVIVSAAQNCTVDATGGISLDAQTSSNFTVTGNAQSLTIATLGGGSQQTIISSAGIGSSAISISGSAGGVAISGAAASSMTTSAGSITMNGKTGVDIQYNSVSQANFGTDGTLTLKASEPYTITHAANGAADDLTISQTGAFDASLLLTSAGTGSDAIDLTASAGGINISSATSSSITTSSGDITINGKGGVDIKYNSVSQADFSANGTLTLKANEPYNITHAANGPADDLTISQTGAFDASLLLTSAGTGSDSIGLSASAGGISISANNTLALTASTVNIARNASNPVNIGFTNSETNVYGNLTVSGNLLINGTTVTNNATVNTYVDPIFYLNSNVSGANTHDIGFVGERGTAGNNVAFIWDEQLDEWAAIETSLTGLGNLLEDPIIKYAPLKVGSFSVDGVTGSIVNIDVTGAITLDTTDTTNGIDIGTANSNVPIDIGATGSTITLTGGVVNSTQTLTSSGAVSLKTLITFIDASGGAITATLANGVTGQTKILIMTNSSNTASLSPTTRLGFTNIVFDGNGDSVTLIYTTNGWVIVNERNTTIS